MAEGECKNIRRSVMDTQLLRTSYSTLFSTSPQTGLYEVRICLLQVEINKIFNYINIYKC